MIDALAENLVFQPLKFSRNKLEHIIEPADTALVSRVGLRYFLDLKIPDFVGSSDWELLHTSEGREKPPYDMSGSTFYEGARFGYNRGRGGKIDSLLEYLKPVFGQNALRSSVTQTIPFQLVERVTGGSPAVNTARTIPTQYAVKAGLSNEDYALHGATFWYRYQADNRKFLTWQPNHKRVSEGQEEYLYFLINFSPLPVQIRLRVHFYNFGENPTEALTVAGIDNVQLYGVVSVPVGPAMVGITTDYDYYDVWLADEANNRLSEVRSFFVDRNLEKFERGVLFVNSLGGWDTLRTTGRGAASLKVAQGLAQRDRSADSLAEFRDTLIVKVEGEREITFSTGYLRKDGAMLLSWLDELLLSDEVYLITPKGHRPVQLMTSSLVDMEDDPDLVARTLTFRLLETVENYSNMPATSTAPERATTYVGINPVYELDSFGKRTGNATYTTLKKVYADNFQAVVPYVFKNNIPGDEDYIPSYQDLLITPGSTPYPSDVYAANSTYQNQTCGAGLTGGVFQIVIPAGRYGAERAGDANLRAVAEWNSLNTQVYANANGACVLPQFYVVNVPSGKFHYRNAMPAANVGMWRSGLGGGYQGNYAPVVASNPDPSNSWAGGSNDIDMPTQSQWFSIWYFGVVNDTGITRTANVEIYKDGVLWYLDVATYMTAGNSYSFVLPTIPSGSKLYINWFWS